MLLAGDFIPKALKIKLPECFSRELVLANLEGPVCADDLPVSNKVGVCLHSAPFDVLGGWAFALANNHMMDFKEEGLREARRFCGEKGYVFAGAGDTENEARKPMFCEEDGMRVAVFSCCERQFGMATETTSGCATMGNWLYAAIQSVKMSNEADRVVVSCHAANEFCPWPSPELREFYHSLVDSGADVIHGHHSHVPQGWETYKGKPIFFGLGNFVVDTAMWSGNPNQLWSLVVEIRFSSQGDTFKVTPYRVFSDEKSVGLKRIEDDTSVDAYLDAINAPFAVEATISLESVWQEAAIRLYPRIYSQAIRAPGVEKRKLSLRDRLRKAYFSLRDLAYALCGREWATSKSVFYAKCLYNYFNCPSHQQAISTALGVLTGVIPDRRTAETRRLAEKVGLT